MDAYPPTAADYANAAAQQAQGTADAALRKKRELEERVIVLEGQVSFLAQIVYDLLTGQGESVSNEQLNMVDRIRKYNKE